MQNPRDTVKCFLKNITSDEKRVFVKGNLNHKKEE